MKRLLLLLSFILIATSCEAATTTAVAGGGNWNATTTWDTGEVPLADDDVVLAAGSGAVTINAASACRSINASAYVSTLTHAAAVALTIGDATAGAGNVALAFNPDMTYTLGNATTSSISFISTSATVQTIDFSGKDTGNVTFNAASNGSWQLTGQWNTSSVGAAQTTALTKGTLDTNDQTVYCALFQSGGTNTRALDLGASTLYVLRAGSTGAFSMTSTGMTLTAGSSTIIFSGGASTFTGGGLTYGTVDFLSSSIIAGNNTFGTFQSTGTAVKTNSLSLSANQIVTGTLNIDGNSAINRVLVTSNILGTARVLTLTGATVSGCSNVDFRDITFNSTTEADIDLSAITGGSGDCGGNTRTGGTARSVIFTTADDWYWNGSGTRNFSDYTYWYTATNGGGSQMASTRCPLPQDTCYIDGASIDGATTINLDLPRLGTLDASDAAAFTLNLVNTGISSTNQIHGSLEVNSNTTVTETGAQVSNEQFYGRGSYVFNGAGKQFGGLQFYMFGGTLTLAGNMNTSNIRTCTLFNGTFDAATYNVTTGEFNSSNSNTREIDFGSGTWTLGGGTATPLTLTTATNLTVTAGTATIAIISGSATTRTVAGGGKTFYNITFQGGATLNYNITGSNTFNTFTINAPATVKFTAGTTTTVADFTRNAGTDEIHLDSVTAASKWTITKTGGGTVEEDYLFPTDSEATPAATWYYGANGAGDVYSNANGWAASATTTAAPRRLLMGIGR